MGEQDLASIEEKRKKAELSEKKARKEKRKKERKSFMAEFKKFITRGNVVDMAVGVAVATAFTAIVTAFTKGFISPLLALLSNDASLDDLKWVIREAVTDSEGAVVKGEVAILWGAFLQAIINFLIIAFALFLLIKIIAGISKRANKIVADIKKLSEDEEEQAKAKAEAEKAAAEAKKAAEAARLAEEQRAAEEKKFRDAAYEQNELLREIKELLKSQQK